MSPSSSHQHPAATRMSRKSTNSKSKSKSRNDQDKRIERDYFFYATTTEEERALLDCNGSLTKARRERRRQIQNRISACRSRAKDTAIVHYQNALIEILLCIISRLNGFATRPGSEVEMNSPTCSPAGLPAEYRLVSKVDQSQETLKKKFNIYDNLPDLTTLPLHLALLTNLAIPSKKDFMPPAGIHYHESGEDEIEEENADLTNNDNNSSTDNQDTDIGSVTDDDDVHSNPLSPGSLQSASSSLSLSSLSLSSISDNDSIVRDDCKLNTFFGQQHLPLTTAQGLPWIPSETLCVFPYESHQSDRFQQINPSSLLRHSHRPSAQKRMIQRDPADDCDLKGSSSNKHPNLTDDPKDRFNPSEHDH